MECRLSSRYQRLPQHKRSERRHPPLWEFIGTCGTKNRRLSSVSVGQFRRKPKSHWAKSGALLRLAPQRRGIRSHLQGDDRLDIRCLAVPSVIPPSLARECTFSRRPHSDRRTTQEISVLKSLVRCSFAECPRSFGRLLLNPCP